MLKKILIIDDHEEYRSILEEALTYSDFEVKGIESSRDLFNEIDKLLRRYSMRCVLLS